MIPVAACLYQAVAPQQGVSERSVFHDSTWSVVDVAVTGDAVYPHPTGIFVSGSPIEFREAGPNGASECPNSKMVTFVLTGPDAGTCKLRAGVAFLGGGQEIFRVQGSHAYSFRFIHREPPIYIAPQLFDGRWSDSFNLAVQSDLGAIAGLATAEQISPVMEASALQNAVNEANNSPNGQGRISFVNPESDPENSVFANPSWLFGVNDDIDLSPQDEVAASRHAACDADETDPVQRLQCYRASAGHPNVLGARQYAARIWPLCERVATVSAFLTMGLPVDLLLSQAI
jgi:hypothetical protein